MYEADDLLSGYEDGINPILGKSQLTCFCCGLCCHYRVFISLEEAQCIAADQNLPLEAFLDLVNEHYWFGQESFLIQQREGFCVFLEGKEGTGARFCRIHHVKPSVCREWAPTFHRPECQQGLAIYWRLTMDEANGIIQGPEEQVQQFNSFMEKLSNGTL